MEEEEGILAEPTFVSILKKINPLFQKKFVEYVAQEEQKISLYSILVNARVVFDMYTKIGNDTKKRNGSFKLSIYSPQHTHMSHIVCWNG
jgi:hypothetical protein